MSLAVRRREGDGHGRCGSRRPGPGSVPAARRDPGGLPGGDRAGLAAPGPGRAPRLPAGRRRDAAAGRFRALAEAWQVLGDPGRRAAYDRALAREQQPAIRVTVQRPAAPAGSDGRSARVPGPPLRAGPVRMEGARPGRRRPAGMRRIRLALLAELLLRYLARDRGRPW